MRTHDYARALMHLACGMRIDGTGGKSGGSTLTRKECPDGQDGLHVGARGHVDSRDISQADAQERQN